MKKALLMMILFCSTAIYAQNSNAWKLYKKQNGVSIFYKTDQCIDIENGYNHEVILFKYSNATQEVKKINYNFEAWFNGTCNNCNGDKSNQKSIVLKPGEETTIDCKDFKNFDKIVFTKHLVNKNQLTFTKFEFNNLIVE
jgi:hypothetical protein